MIICAESEGDINPRNKNNHGSKDPRRFQLFHGLTPPLKNVKKSRFRKIIRKRHCEAPEVEKELKRLLRDDMGTFFIKTLNFFRDFRTETQLAQSKQLINLIISKYKQAN